MKVKYKYIGYKFLIAKNKLEQLFEKQAKQGWMLEEIGMSFFKFKKTQPQQLKFFIDCNRPTDDYILSLEECGYHYIDNYQLFNVFYSEDMQIEPIQSDPVVKAISRKDTCKPWQIIFSLLGGLFIYHIVDIFGLSYVFFQIFDHIILHFRGFLVYLLLKIGGAFFVFNAMTLLVLRIKYNRDIKNLPTPKIITTIFFVLHYLFAAVIILLAIFTSFVYSINDPSFILTMLLFLITFMIFNHYVNKQIIKVESKTKRFILTVAALVLFVSSYEMFSQYILKPVVSTPSSQAYEKDTHNFSHTTRTLLYTIIANYGTSNQKNEFDEYNQTYRETIYICQNETIAKCIFRALVKDADQQRRVPSDEEIDRIVEEKGEFSTLEDVPFYDYQTSLDHLTSYQFHNIDICCGYDNNYVAIKDHIVYDLTVKDGTDIQKLINFYQ